MNKTITPLRAWMRAATPDERQILAKRVGTSVGMLQQYAGGYRLVTASVAGAIEDATAAMHRASKGRLPTVVRTDMCAACRACPYAAKCLGERAVVSDFPIVADPQVEMAL
jgi:hypothetical protein